LGGPQGDFIVVDRSAGSVAFTDSADHVVDYVKLLQQLAKDSGGTVAACERGSPEIAP
jgi:hypothetical protein